MTTIEFVIPSNPVPKGRQRSTKRGITYTPEKTRKYEDNVRSVSSQYAPKELLKGALEMELHFFLQRPKSLPKKGLRVTKQYGEPRVEVKITDDDVRVMDLGGQERLG